MTFRVGNESLNNNVKEIGGIRVLFASTSKVFDKILFGNMIESKDKSIVTINDINPDIMD